jgi:hypothetical protein
VPIADPMLLREVLCVQEERIVARDNTVNFSRRKLQRSGASEIRIHGESERAAAGLPFPPSGLRKSNQSSSNASL